MTSFVHLNYANEHPGVQRAEAIAEAAGRFRRSFDKTKGLAAMLLAAMVAALMVVADQLVSVWADGYLLASWVTLWAIAFAALALMAPTAQRMASSMSASLKGYATRLASERNDARYWESAKSDPRVMAELQAAILRSEHAGESESAKASQSTTAVNVARVAKSEVQLDPAEPARPLGWMDSLNTGSRYFRHF